MRKAAAAMRAVSNQMMRDSFLGWQCRIRQLSVRDYDGQPLPAMMPQVSGRTGDVLVPAMMSLLVPQEPGPATDFLKFQVQKNNEHQKARASALHYLSADFYQQPELFADEMTAVFGPASATAGMLAAKREVLLSFAQYSQSYRMFCKVKTLGAGNEARAFSLWQARIFNPNIPNDAMVLGFRPDWKNAVADPLP